MGFNTRSKGNSDSSGSNVDWSALNDHVIEAADLEQEESVVGVVSGIIDLGLQEQEDAKMEFNGTEEDEAAEMEKNPECYFEDLIDYNDNKKEKRYKRWPQKDKQCVAVMVDFPDIIIDKGQFFGESNPAPLRLLLGGEFFANGKSIVARMIDLSVRKNDKTHNKWSFAPNHTFYKMAKAAKLVKEGEPFLPDNIDKLLGEAFQFKVQICKNSKGYYTEKCSFLGGLGRGMQAPEFDESLLHLVQFTEDNDTSALKQLRLSVRNTMENSTEWEDSLVKKQLEGLKSESKTSKEEGKESVKEKSSSKKEPKKVEVEEEEDFPESDVPF